MENFFDVATSEELKEILGEDIDDEFIEILKKSYKEFPDANYGRLFELYILRNDNEIASYYLDKIQDKSFKFQKYHEVCAPLL